MYFLTICTVILDNQDTQPLTDWIEFHLNRGVNHIHILYQTNVFHLEKYITAGFVSTHKLVTDKLQLPTESQWTIVMKGLDFIWSPDTFWIPSLLEQFKNTSITFNEIQCIHHQFINQVQSTTRLTSSTTPPPTDFVWNVPLNDMLGECFMTHEPHITKFIQKFLKKGDWALDIGACFGLHTLTMAKTVGFLGKVFAFEPQDAMLNLLKQNITDNYITNAQVIATALGNINKKTCMYSAYDKVSNCGDAYVSLDYKMDAEDDFHTFQQMTKGGVLLPIKKEIVECNELDNFLALFSQPIKFVKIDVQGFERMVLRGGREFIRAHRPLMVVEIEEVLTLLHGYSTRDLLDELYQMQYTVLYLEHTYPSDHLCVPNEKLLEFQQEFGEYIKPHTEDNPVNYNFSNGIIYKLSF